MIICPELIFSSDGIQYDLRLNGRILTVGGDSASGKTLLLDRLRKLKTLPEYSFIQDFDYTTHNFSKRLSECHKNLVVIDNADIIVGKQDIVFINHSTDNQFLLFSRSLEGLDTTLLHRKVLVYKNRTFSLKGEFDELFSLD